MGLNELKLSVLGKIFSILIENDPLKYYSNLINRALEKSLAPKKGLSEGEVGIVEKIDSVELGRVVSKHSRLKVKARKNHKE